MKNQIDRILASKKRLVAGLPRTPGDPVEEGGCGVVGFASSIPVSGRHIFEPSIQMHNRGNGKGGGIAASGLVADQIGVDEDILRSHYLMQVAYLNPACQPQVEEAFVKGRLQVAHQETISHIDEHGDVGLDVRPPEIVRYIVRADEKALKAFEKENELSGMEARAIEDEFIYQNSFTLNQQFYASLGEQQAFVLSHARDLVIFKIVGYAEQVVQYYQLDDMAANVWIAHQRYPTKGRVWHPAGAHPFIGLNEALVHNGDFANYFSISEYLRQHNIAPQFLTDTEVSVLIFDLLHRTYGYPLEYVIEALAPTTELDFDRLPPDKQKIYRAIQGVHIHGSPDGPWFFIIARSEPDTRTCRLIGITDTAMLRPQVFALQEGDVSIGLVGSEKQAIDATLKSLHAEDPRFRPVADKYWNARGGSSSDGGSFIFNVTHTDDGPVLTCTDKFGTPITVASGDYTFDPESTGTAPDGGDEILSCIADPYPAFEKIAAAICGWSLDNVRWLMGRILEQGESLTATLDLLALLNDRRYDCGAMKRSVVLQLIRETIDAVLDAVPLIDGDGAGPARRIGWDNRDALRAPAGDEEILVVHASDFPMEGDDCNSRLEVAAYGLGWKHFIIYGLKGQRFTGCGMGPDTAGVRIDVFGCSGDYLCSGNDGIEIYVHDNAQDQLCQIMKRGKLVIHGDVGQTFMYGAKGGDVYVMGNAAGRPLINAVGRPRVVINGTALDFLAESFMAGDPHNGGGFVILNGITFDDRGNVIELDNPYPGANLFSLASGGAIFVRDPHGKLVSEQLNGGEFAEMTDADWELIRSYLEENEKQFGISIEQDLLNVDGAVKAPTDVYRKVVPARLAVLAAAEETE